MKNDLIIGCKLSSGTYQSIKEDIIRKALSLNSSYVCVANVHMLIEAYQDKAFANIVNNADIVTPDGMPLVKSLKYIYGVNQERVAGMDLLPDLLSESEHLGIPVFFYGGTQEMLDKTREHCISRYPKLLISGLHSPPFRDLTIYEESSIIDNINNSEAKFVFVALGCPKQEKWMASMKGRINACMIGIGGALPVMIGLQARAPKWMQKYSLEWLYRLSQEPGRLWKRYFYTNTLFLFLFTKEFVKSRFSSGKLTNH